MTSPDNAPVPAETQGQAVGGWGFDDLIDGLADGVGGWIRGFIVAALRTLADGLGGTPIIGTTLEAIVDGIADFINGVEVAANTAQASADVAYGNAGAAYAAATAAQDAASDAANVAAAAAEVADIAYANAQYWKDEFSCSSSGVNYGKNEEPLGMVMDVPPGKVRKITAIRYGCLVNTGVLTVEVRKITLAGVESVIHTTVIPSAATKYRDSSIDYQVADGDYILASVLTNTGTTSVLHVALIGVLIDEEP
ncbi:hypothetical protein ACTD5D_39705 [Nocardia takedensis]|uniref:hypothetical protein n=1 Tax=Nocardia takedensis TaxID=259390 RepID=UPI003F770B63